MKWILAAIAVVGLVVVGKVWEWTHRSRDTMSPRWLNEHGQRKWQ